MNRYSAIASCRSFITIAPPGGYDDPSNAEGARLLRMAILMAKPVVVWRVPGRHLQTLPQYLLQYNDVTVIDGDVRKFRLEFAAWMDRRGFKPHGLQDLDGWIGKGGA